MSTVVLVVATPAAGICRARDLQPQNYIAFLYCLAHSTSCFTMQAACMDGSLQACSCRQERAVCTTTSPAQHICHSLQAVIASLSVITNRSCRSSLESVTRSSV